MTPHFASRNAAAVARHPKPYFTLRRKLIEDASGAYRVGQLACELVEQRGLRRFQAGVYLNFGNMVMPWTRHIRTCCELIGRAFDAAQKTGDLVYARICSGLRVLNLLAVGDALADIEREAERVHLGHMQLGTNLEIIGVALAIVRTLRGVSA